MLTNDPNLEKLGLDGGLNYWLLRNTHALSEQATAARDVWENKDRTALRQHLVNMLYYLAGNTCVPSDLNGLPSGRPLHQIPLAHDTSASLLEGKQNSVISSIPVHIQTHILGMIHAPEATHNQAVLTQQVRTKLTQVQVLLEQLHQKVLQLVQLPNT